MQYLVRVVPTQHGHLFEKVYANPDGKYDKPMMHAPDEYENAQITNEFLGKDLRLHSSSLFSTIQNDREFKVRHMATYRIITVCEDEHDQQVGQQDNEEAAQKADSTSPYNNSANPANFRTDDLVESETCMREQAPETANPAKYRIKKRPRQETVSQVQVQSEIIQDLKDLPQRIMEEFESTAVRLRKQSERLGFKKDGKPPRLAPENFQRVKHLKTHCSTFLHTNTKKDIPKWWEKQTIGEIRHIFQMDAQHLKWIESTYASFYSAPPTNSVPTTPAAPPTTSSPTTTSAPPTNSTQNAALDEALLAEIEEVEPFGYRSLNLKSSGLDGTSYSHIDCISLSD